MVYQWRVLYPSTASDFPAVLVRSIKAKLQAPGPHELGNPQEISLHAASLHSECILSARYCAETYSLGEWVDFKTRAVVIFI